MSVMKMIVAMLKSKERESAAHRFPLFVMTAFIFEATRIGHASKPEGGGSLFWVFEGWGIG